MAKFLSEVPHLDLDIIAEKCSTGEWKRIGLSFEKTHGFVIKYNQLKAKHLHADDETLCKEMFAELANRAIKIKQLVSVLEDSRIGLSSVAGYLRKLMKKSQEDEESDDEDEDEDEDSDEEDDDEEEEDSTDIDDVAEFLALKYLSKKRARKEESDEDEPPKKKKKTGSISTTKLVKLLNHLTKDEVSAIYEASNKNNSAGRSSKGELIDLIELEVTTAQKLKRVLLEALYRDSLVDYARHIGVGTAKMKAGEAADAIVAHCKT